MTPARPVRLMLVDDHLVVRMGLIAILKAEPRLRIIAEAEDVATAQAQYRAHQPDVTLMDLRLPGGGGIEAVKAIRAEHPDARILMLTTFDLEEEIHGALQAGACGYLLKNISREDLVQAIIAAHRDGTSTVSPEVAERLADSEGSAGLTAREREVLDLMVKGLTNKDIARILGFTPRTSKAHVKHLLNKLGASDRTEAVALALQRGIVPMH